MRVALNSPVARLWQGKGEIFISINLDRDPERSDTLVENLEWVEVTKSGSKKNLRSPKAGPNPLQTCDPLLVT